MIFYSGPPHGVEVERWLCIPRVSCSNPGTGNLEKLFIWMKIHGLAQKKNVTELYSLLDYSITIH